MMMMRIRLRFMIQLLIYGKCGPFGSCKEWNAANWSNGCTRRTPLQNERNNSVGEIDGFLELNRVKLPDNTRWSLTFEADCGSRCLNSSPCIAYAYYIGIGWVYAFEPTNREEWERGNWTSACQRRRQLQCDQSGGGNGNGFLRLPFMKAPDFAEHFSSGQVEECLARCSRNCSCLVYAHDSYIGCMFWSESLIDLQKFSSVGVDLYIRLEDSELVERFACRVDSAYKPRLLRERAHDHSA
ncbi:hypothetical protein BUALT_Bualt03G0068400 [Buddleja alternifolia]|uniref:Apple domain-containing protein n=1 Tax=Buddleja alternifolia TaxID=168488 RepID=A0AAV6XRN9_9LAMI|nr:hypothetical protein BUALT_Bualt03G0068400 [Buddleja alternifolia]